MGSRISTMTTHVCVKLFRCKFFCFSQNSIMDMRGFFNGSKNEKKPRRIVLKRNDLLKKVQV